MALETEQVLGRAAGSSVHASGQHSTVPSMPVRAVSAVRRAAAGCPALRRVWAVLSRDLLALLAGLRPAVMLDYVIGAHELALCRLAREVSSLVSSPAGALAIPITIASSSPGLHHFISRTCAAQLQSCILA